MNNENRKEWAILLSGNLAKGETIVIQIVRPCGGHGGGYLDRETETIKVSNVKELKPNMLLVQTEDMDYYMYNYKLYGQNLSYIDGDNGWSIEEKPKIGEDCLFSRLEKKGCRAEGFLTNNPVFKIDVIHARLAIAWCKDEMGEDVGYVIKSKTFKDAPTGNYYWIWNLEAQKAGKKTIGYITVDFAGKGVTSFVSFVPQRATAIGNWTILEAEDGNFYIWQVPIEIGWEE